MTAEPVEVIPYVDPVLIVVACADGTVQTQARPFPDGHQLDAEQVATFLEQLAGRVRARPHGGNFLGEDGPR